jgi:hypothetical protein
VGAAMRTVMLVPRRAQPDRDKLWDWCKARWQAILPEIPIYEGHHDEGPFNRSAAINRAARLADGDGGWDVAVVIDADIFIRRSQVEAAVASAAKTGRVTWAHRRWRGIREDLTPRIIRYQQDFGPEIDREDMDVLVERTNPLSWSCCIAIPRAVWDDLGGFDERFRGWGFEDMAFQSAVCGLYGHERIQGDVYHLWHARTTDGQGRAAKTSSGYTADAITNARLGRRYMVALRRDYALHDRSDIAMTDAERERDVANLKRDDEKLASDVRRLKLPDWTDWWPTLEELKDGAIAYREAAEHAITVVVHTGGLPENWPTRREYLARSVRSLSEQVTGPIVQRVVYDCWGDEAIRGEIKAIVEPLGFYVAGPVDRPDYTRSMQELWRYLGRRAIGEFVFQAEDDFTFDRPVDLLPMARLLRDDHHLSQIALLRHAAYESERRKGGILGWSEDHFTRRGTNGTSRLEHRLFWTANPSLFRKSLTKTAWPAAPSSEKRFAEALFRDPAVISSFWGSGEAWITHIGEIRAGAGY